MIDKFRCIIQVITQAPTYNMMTTVAPGNVACYQQFSNNPQFSNNSQNIYGYPQNPAYQQNLPMDYPQGPLPSYDYAVKEQKTAPDVANV